ncbi:MAG: aspartate aminotransferase family protein [Gammaproteobacteria bacterium]
MPQPQSSSSDILARRQRVLAPTYRLFYEEPVHVVRAEGLWMYDADGRRYLDAYNNVPVVGHCHPYVVEALTRQARTLNTHTRYLTDGPLELAERLLATLPPELGNVTFTCTGSEANDLAARISKAATGGTGFIVTDFAYHGTTETIAAMSPALGIAPQPNVFTVPAPVGAENAALFGARVRECIERMRALGVKPAALLVDTIFSSDGVASHPASSINAGATAGASTGTSADAGDQTRQAGFLAAAVDEIHKAGGLFIADEVQPGFGRTGDAMWGFQRHGVVPDLVTMGKPMGNGHPVAAVVARPEVITEFAKRTRYFNTFGGNTVSCAVALAVLDVIEKEQLVANARDVGAYLRAGLRSLMDGHPSVKEVRGAGLFIGVQIESREETLRIVNGLRRAGVLINSAGRNQDALKIRPPLTFGRAEADILLTTLEDVLLGAP